MARVGDTGWIVEWCTHREHYDNGDIDIDSCRFRKAVVSTRADAIAKAKEVFPIAKLPCVDIVAATFTAYDEEDRDLYPGAGYWDTDESTFERFECDEDFASAR